mmetsp:Transcript_6061/g.16341  ORF Transcript_6061/g.16341 Transcript_6061/m.16341 type:complete len:221 (-) Transcript_6061:11-673(-)
MMAASCIASDLSASWWKYSCLIAGESFAKLQIASSSCSGDQLRRRSCILRSPSRNSSFSTNCLRSLASTWSAKGSSCRAASFGGLFVWATGASAASLSSEARAAALQWCTKSFSLAFTLASVAFLTANCATAAAICARRSSPSVSDAAAPASTSLPASSSCTVGTADAAADVGVALRPSRRQSATTAALNKRTTARPASIAAGLHRVRYSIRRGVSRAES